MNFYKYVSEIWNNEKKKQHQFRRVAKQFFSMKNANSVLSDVAVCSTVNIANSDATQPTAF